MRVRSLLTAAVLAATAAPSNAAEAPFLSRFYGIAQETDSSMFVQGTAVMFGENPLIVGSDPQGDFFPSSLGLVGTDARALAIWQENATIPTLTFALSLWDLQLAVPEMTAWRWTFTTRGQMYRLEAVRGGVTADGTLDEPSMSIERTDPINGTFRLLGPCSAPPTDPFEDLTCPIITSIPGTIDANSDRILWQVPMEADGLFRLGDTISPAPAGGIAELRLGPQRYTDTITQSGSYTIAGPRIRAGIQALGADPTLANLDTEVFTLHRSGSNEFDFFGFVDLTNIDKGPPGPNRYYQAVAEACVGTLCGIRATFPVTL